MLEKDDSKFEIETLWEYKYTPTLLNSKVDSIIEYSFAFEDEQRQFKARRSKC